MDNMLTHSSYLDGQAGGMGEGWGDFWATSFLQKKEYKPTDAFPMGNYAAGRGK
jgi:extracellular elastinolytic metalloproteinase